MKNPLYARLFPPVFALAFVLLAAHSRAAEPGETPTAAPATPQSPAPDKSGYTLFNPTPADLLRELACDRPDVTEGPFTVDAGHLQIESSFFEYARDRRTTDAQHTSTWEYAPTNLRLGLDNRAEVDFIFTPYVDEKDTDRNTGTSTHARGFDDIQFRAKFNLWGNDPVAGQSTAFALLPFIQLPTGSDSLSTGHVQGGLILPLAMKLTDDLNLTVMGEFDLRYDPDRRGYQFDFVHTASLDYDLFGGLGGYIEYVGDISSQSHTQYQVSADIGFTYRITENMAIDAGVNFGLTRPAEDIRVFTGITIRF